MQAPLPNARHFNVVLDFSQHLLFLIATNTSTTRRAQCPSCAITYQLSNISRTQRPSGTSVSLQEASWNISTVRCLRKKSAPRHKYATQQVQRSLHCKDTRSILRSGTETMSTVLPTTVSQPTAWETSQNHQESHQVPGTWHPGTPSSAVTESGRRAVRNFGKGSSNLSPRTISSAQDPCSPPSSTSSKRLDQHHQKVHANAP